MSSKRAKRRKACGDKVRYADEAEANRVCWRLCRTSADFLQAYRCPFSGKGKGHWHIGHYRGGVKV